MPTSRETFPPRLNTGLATLFTGMSERQLKRLRQKRAVRFFRTGHRTVVFDRDSLAAWLDAHAVEPLGGGEK